MQQRIAPVDALRGVASIGVALIFHLRYLSGDLSIDHPELMPLGWFLPIERIYRHGDMLVELFFVLSGFIFHHIYRQDDGPTRASAADFASARFARLYPLMALSTVLAGLAVYLGIGLTGHAYEDWGHAPADWIRNLLGLQFLRVEPASLNAPTWSVSVELICYAAFYVLARQRSPLFYAGSAMLLLCGLYSLAWVLGPKLPWFIARGVLGFFTGVLLYGVKEWFARLPLVALAALLIAAGTLVWIDPWPLSRFASNALMTVMIWPLVLLVALRAPVARWLDNRVMMLLGDLSYSIYLLHMPIILAILALHANQPFSPQQIAWLWPPLVIATLLLAWLSLHYIEMPLRRRLRIRRPVVKMTELG
ncbi:acyltransferase [Sphingomonas sp.]|uniref:acyltransferase family protein n=1 Tax=Sphingomonas sp. TaxID=28214 RepID=UPI000DB4783C|nr:acyltransferase [Sphingomonas sp.]PZU09593.1 MAG: hypothetical protein DI605_07920 [Sphingomonas sp.]